MVRTSASMFIATAQMKGVFMPDANISIPAEARDLLARKALAEGMSLRAYLSRLANETLKPDERTARAKQARAILHAWSGYDLSSDEEAALDAELDRRLARIGSQ